MPACGLSSRMPAKRRNDASGSARSTTTPTATSPTTPASISVRRRVSWKRRRASKATTTVATMSPATAAVLPERISPDPAVNPRAVSRRSSGHEPPVTIPVVPIPNAIAHSAARSWCPRNEGCRHPAFQASKIGTPLNWRSATADAATAQAAIVHSSGWRSAGRRTRSGTATASSAYSANFAAVTAWFAKPSAPPLLRNVSTAIHARSPPAASQSARPCRSGAKPCRTPLTSAATAIASTARSDSVAVAVVEPRLTSTEGW